MKWSSALVAAYGVGLAAAHGIPGVPHIVGGRRHMAEIRAELDNRHREAEGGAGSFHHIERSRVPRDPPTPVQERATSTNTDGQCGPGYGSCADGYCCSSAGYVRPLPLKGLDL